MIRTQVQLAEEQVASLRQQAARLGVSIADLVRRAVDSWTPTRAPVSAAELRRRALEAAGRYASGDSDGARRHDDFLAEVYRS